MIQLSQKPVESPQTTNGTDFETAIDETGFGRFNYFTIFIGCVCGLASMTMTTSMSLIFPSAQCDLNLSLSDKGALNAATYGGMIISAIIWGFLADILGRRKILMYGYLTTFVFDVFTGLSQNFWSLIIAKFGGGFM